MGFNKLTDSQAERLALLSEEFGEAQQAIGKILRHGYDCYNPNDPVQIPNRKRLEWELGDITAALQLLAKAGDISKSDIEACAKQKLLRVKAYLHHQAET